MKNILDLMILAILAISVISGMIKGFLASGLTIAGFVAAWAGAMHFTPQLSGAILGNKGIMDVLFYYIAPAELFKNADWAGRLASAVTKTEAAQAAEGLPLPGLITEEFVKNVANRAFASLNLQTLAEYLGQTICVAAVNILSFLILFAVTYCVVLLVASLLSRVFRFPVLRHFDWLLGGVFGLIRGAVVAMLLFSLLTPVLSMIDMPFVTDIVSASKLYGIFSQSNIVERIVSMIS